MDNLELWAVGGAGAALLLLTGVGLGRSLRAGGMGNSLLVASLLGFVGGLVLTGYAALHGPDLPLVVGAVGTALLMAQQTR